MVDTFKQENKHLRLAADAAYILADLTYCTKEDGGNTVSKLMAYEFVENLLSLFDDIEATD